MKNNTPADVFWIEVEMQIVLYSQYDVGHLHNNVFESVLRSRRNIILFCLCICADIVF